MSQKTKNNIRFGLKDAWDFRLEISLSVSQTKIADGWMIKWLEMIIEGKKKKETQQQ